MKCARLPANMRSRRRSHPNRLCAILFLPFAMDNEPKKEKRRALKSLRAAQDRHARLLDKVSAARTELDERRRELRTVEAEIASLTRRLYKPVNGEHQAESSDANVRRARLIFDDEAHGTKPLKEIVKRLRAQGIIAEADLELSDAFVDELAREAVEAEEELLIVAAGDATVRRVAAQLNNSQTALGIIPVGESNRIAETLHIPEALDAACTLIGTAPPHLVDLRSMLGEQVTAGAVLVIAPEPAA
jgi:predicted RNase H-like nuclease (RuvC/YqgF family)